MPTPRLRGGTALTTRPSKRIAPASGRSKPAIIRSVVVLPQPEPPTRETSSPWPISRESPFPASAAPGGVGGHRRLRHRPVEEALGVLGVLGALHERIALERPRDAVVGIDDV